MYRLVFELAGDGALCLPAAINHPRNFPIFSVYLDGHRVAIFDLRSPAFALSPVVDVPCVFVVSDEFLVVLRASDASHCRSGNAVHERPIVSGPNLAEGVSGDLVFLYLVLADEQVPASPHVLLVAGADVGEFYVVGVELICHKSPSALQCALQLLLLLLAPLAELGQFREDAVQNFIFLGQAALQGRHFLS